LSPKSSSLAQTVAPASSSVSSSSSSISTASNYNKNANDKDEDEILENNNQKFIDEDDESQQPFMPPHTLTEAPNFWSFSNIKYMEKKKITSIAIE